MSEKDSEQIIGRIAQANAEIVSAVAEILTTVLPLITLNLPPAESATNNPKNEYFEKYKAPFESVQLHDNRLFCPLSCGRYRSRVTLMRHVRERHKDYIKEKLTGLQPVPLNENNSLESKAPMRKIPIRKRYTFK